MLPKGGVVYIRMDCMQIGFIGAGKVGVTLGKYLKEKGMKIGGYYSRSPESAEWAAKFTGTNQYHNLEEIMSNCDMILFTVPDSVISDVWQEARSYASGKIIGHCSGLYSSKIFSEASANGSYAYSIHPLYAVSSKEHSWEEMQDVLFTLEGDEKYLPDIQLLFQNMGNRTRIISAENKTKYHAAAALSSNYMTTLFFMAENLLLECGFEEKEARQELYSLAKGNLEHISEQGCVSSLTGPIERNDSSTVRMHLDALEPEMQEVYRNNASYLIHVAEKKHPERNYSDLKNLLMK